mgnify:CR=1 FL=1
MVYILIFPDYYYYYYLKIDVNNNKKLYHINTNG